MTQWFKREFNQSLLLSFGIKHVSQEDLNFNASLINIYKNFATYQIDPTKFYFPKIRQEKFESMQDVRKHIVYFGLDNQHKILLKLYNLKTIDNIVINLFKNQIRSKLASNLAECLNFLVKFDFSKMTVYQTEFENTCQNLIAD